MPRSCENALRLSAPMKLLEPARGHVVTAPDADRSTPKDQRKKTDEQLVFELHGFCFL